MPPQTRKQRAAEVKKEPQMDASDQHASGIRGPAQTGQGRGRGTSDSKVAEDSVYERIERKLDRIQQQLETLTGLLTDQRQQQAPVVQSKTIPEGKMINQQEKYVAVSLREFIELEPPMFSGIEPDSDPTEFLEQSNKICMALGCSPVRAVELVSFMLRDIAYDWYTSLVQTRKTGDPPLEWPDFSAALLQRFLPESVRDAKAREFEQLRQTDGMSVKEYDIQFTRLSRYAPHLVATEHMRAKRFADGLQGYLFRYVHVSETSSYNQVLDAALRLELRGNKRQAKKAPHKKARVADQSFRQIGEPSADTTSSSFSWARF